MAAAIQRAGATASDAEGPARRTVVIDVGSNSFRLVVFSAVAHGWWRRTDEIHESVRVGEGLDATGALQPAPMARAHSALVAYAHFCQATGIPREAVHPVATSAIRDASNREAFLARARELAGLEIRVLSPREEAWYGLLAALNSSTMRDGVVLDLGGGSLQLVRVEGRRATDLRSWPLGAVRMTERFLSGEGPAKRKQLRALREHVAEAVAEADWLADQDHLVGLGGTLRNLAAAAESAAGLPSFGVQGFRLERAALDALVDELAGRPARERGRLPGIKPDRGDIILAGAVTVQSLLQAADIEAVETTEFGLREGVFLESHLAPLDPPVLEDVRSASVANLAAQYEPDLAHAEHVRTLCVGMWDDLAAAGMHRGDPAERELLAAAAMLHDVGMAIDYDDHHKHSRYLILSAGLPGFDPRETALIAQLARWHRKGTPGLGELGPLARPGDLEFVRRAALVLRLAEQLERARDQVVRAARIVRKDGSFALQLERDGEAGVAAWAAARQAEAFEEVFGTPLDVPV